MDSNTILHNTTYNFIGGGVANLIQSNTVACVIGGGHHNTILTNADGSGILAGSYNVAGGTNSIAGGHGATATHNGTFVWADSQDYVIASSTTNQFTARATGGFRMITAVDGSGNPTKGATLASAGEAWGTISDRAVKKNFRAVDCKEIIEKLARVPVQHWNYKCESDSSTPHLGPVAQDFKAAFFPGRDDKVITTLEFDGVELAAIQGLYQLLVEKDQEISTLRTQLAVHQEFHRSVEVRFADLENAMQVLKTSTRSVVGIVEER